MNPLGGESDQLFDPISESDYASIAKLIDERRVVMEKQVASINALSQNAAAIQAARRAVPGANDCMDELRKTHPDFHQYIVSLEVSTITQLPVQITNYKSEKLASVKTSLVRMAAVLAELNQVNSDIQTCLHDSVQKIENIEQDL
jgi:hypothetical protein